MALDMHSKVTIKSIEWAEILGNDTVLIRVVYRVKHGRKDYKIWLLPADFRGTGIFPVAYRRMGRYADVITMQNEVMYTGSMSDCQEFVKIANKHFMEGA
jgi:hypothetical protein